MLGYLTLALSHAAAYMIAQRVTCTGYLDLYTAGADRLDDLMSKDSDGYTRSVTVTLLVALDAANVAEPAGLAHPTIELAAVLRANTAALVAYSTHVSDALWTSAGGHPLLWRAGQSLHYAGLHGPGIAHWEDTAVTALRILGPDTRAAAEVLPQWGVIPASGACIPAGHQAVGACSEVVSACIRRVFGVNNRNRPDWTGRSRTPRNQPLTTFILVRGHFRW